MNGSVRDIDFTADSKHMLSFGSKIVTMVICLITYHVTKVTVKYTSGIWPVEVVYTNLWMKAVSWVQP